MHPYENIERQEDKESVSLYITLKRHLLFAFCMVNVSDIILGPSQSLRDYAIRSMTVIPTAFKEISDNHGRLHLELARTGAVLPYHRSGCNKKWNSRKWLHHIDAFRMD